MIDRAAMLSSQRRSATKTLLAASDNQHVRSFQQATWGLDRRRSPLAQIIDRSEMAQLY